MTIPIFYPVDTPDYNQACEELRILGDYVDVKVGPVFIYTNGIDACLNLLDAGTTRRRSLFVDAKVHEIPSITGAAIKSIVRSVQPDFITVHACDGIEPLLAAVEAANECPENGYHRPKLLGVTVLTSVTDDRQLDKLEERATDAHIAGFDGLICATEDVSRLREMFADNWPDMYLMVPGIYQNGASEDQKRVGTPVEAKDAGASGLVIGRTIRTSADPRGTAAEIRKSLDIGSC